METSAELRYDAPLATFDGDEWNEFNLDVEVPPAIVAMTTTLETADCSTGCSEELVPLIEHQSCSSCTDVDDGSDIALTGSLEDLVNCFDERIRACFTNYEEKSDRFAPVQIRTEEEVLKDSQTWWTITGNFGGIMPINWSKKFGAKQLESQRILRYNVDAADGYSISDWSDFNQSDNADSDYELDEQTRLQISPPSINDVTEEPVPAEPNADEVINEIEYLFEADTVDDIETDATEMQPYCKCGSENGYSADYDITHVDSPNRPVTDDWPLSSHWPSDAAVNCTKTVRQTKDTFRDNSTLQSSQRPCAKTIQCKDGKSLYRKSVKELLDLVIEMRRQIIVYSEILVRELAHRDEQDFEKELRNQFILLLLRVHRRRQEYSRRLNRRRNHVTPSENEDGDDDEVMLSMSPCRSRAKDRLTSDPEGYLMTVIPYDHALGTPSPDTIQIFIENFD